MNNSNKPILESLINKKSKDRADIVFNKLLSLQKKPKNPFDEARTFTTPSMRETKSGETLIDTV
ncbi:MAG: hypothetical protein IPM56_04065 [Ignavibacteriales bacterium]|nr:MAG: hypothetical protein IPM56_04065 [Ignavibacteriales bacterium]